MKRKNDRGFIATAVLYSLVLLLSMVLFIILKNTSTVRKIIVEDANVVKDQALKYKVYYYGNGQNSGSIPMDTFSSGQKEKLKDCNIFKKTGYTCIQYSTSVLSPNDTCVVDDKTCFHWDREVYNIAYGGKSIDLYAVWKSNIYTITFDKTGGSSGTNNLYEKYDVGWYSDSDATYGLSKIAIPTRRSYAFEGYYTGQNGAGKKVVDASGNIVVPANEFVNHTTVYAKWRLITYTVSFDARGGSVSPTSKTVIYQTAYGALPTPSRVGYTFQGWYTQVSGGTKILSTTEVLITSNQTLYAQWKANNYTVTFNGNGGSVSPASKTVTYDSTYGSLPTPSRSGYDFLGWYTQTSGGARILNTTSVKITSNQTLYAQWRRREYVVTLASDLRSLAHWKRRRDESLGSVGFGNGYVSLIENYAITSTEYANFIMTKSPVDVTPFKTLRITIADAACGSTTAYPNSWGFQFGIMPVSPRETIATGHGCINGGTYEQFDIRCVPGPHFEGQGKGIFVHEFHRRFEGNNSCYNSTIAEKNKDGDWICSGASPSYYQTYSLDISGYSGSYYLGFAAAANFHTCYKGVVTKFWME